MNPSESLSRVLAQECIQCGLCLKECAFLRKFGSPVAIAASLAEGPEGAAADPFSCSLCGLCSAVCPKKLDIPALMLALRQEAVARKEGFFREHDTIRGYENKGVSPLFSWYGLPEGCDTVFFPGCTLPGTRPEATRRLFALLADRIPRLGMVLDCCTKPSHDLGDRKRFTMYFEEMRAFLLVSGISRVLVACPNCYKVFSRYGEGLSTQTVWKYLEKAPVEQTTGIVTIHDSCVIRDESGVQDAVRSLVSATGCTVSEMRHNRKKTLCCGEGGSVGFHAPEIAATWSDLRREEAGENRIVTYCAGCAGLLKSKGLKVIHLLDLYLDPKAALAGHVRVSKAPFTYWNRLWLKKYVQRSISGPFCRSRPVLEKKKLSDAGKKILLFCTLIALIVGFRVVGVAAPEPERFREFAAAYPALAPFVYLLLYSLAPALLLPGLPFAMAAGLLFGPVWGVVLALSGATIGASLAFLLARYLGRDWVARKLAGPQWRKLEASVEKDGWKVVAFTRLIPVFPFNLLNYAFGLTSIPFRHYVLTSLVFMLPGCLAFVVFSSSLLDLLAGSVTREFLAGGALLVVVTALPVIYRKFPSKYK